MRRLAFLSFVSLFFLVIPAHNAVAVSFEATSDQAEHQKPPPPPPPPGPIGPESGGPPRPAQAPGPIGPDPGGPPQPASRRMPAQPQPRQAPQPAPRSAPARPTTGTTGTTTYNTTTGTTTTTTGSYDTSTTTSSTSLPRTDYDEPQVRRIHRIRGEVREVDQKHHTLSMRSKDTTHPYRITNKSAFLPKGTSLDTLKAGEHVSISYVFSHRRRVAVGITVLR